MATGKSASGKAAFEKKLEALRALRQSSDARTGVAKALGDASNYVVSKAAEMCAELGLRELAPELVSAFDRLMADGAKDDPQCWGKLAIVKALGEMAWRSPEVFARGLRYRQMEPVWSGTTDTAMGVRAACAEALVSTELDGVSILRLLVWALGDDAKLVRVAAVGALAQLSRWEGELLLRQLAIRGDTEPEVMGACLSGILELGERGALDFVASFVGEDDARGLEAIAALAQSRHAEAIRAVMARWERGLGLEAQKTIAISLGASPLEEARDALLRVLGEARAEVAVCAVTGLASSRYREEVRERVREITAGKKDWRVTEAFQTEFGLATPRMSLSL